MLLRGAVKKKIIIFKYKIFDHLLQQKGGYNIPEDHWVLLWIHKSKVICHSF